MPTSNAERRESFAHAAAAALGVAVFLVLWGLTSRVVDSEIILPSPLRVARAAAELFPTRKFLEALGATFLRGVSSFAVSMPLGILMGLACGLSRPFRFAAAPLLTVIRATPVLAVILLALIWFPSGIVPVFAAVLMSFPVVVSDVQAGVLAADPRLLEMARVFRLKKRDVIRAVYVPSVAPHLASAAYGALGLSWKVVVAGEVLSQPLRALGTGMQGARIQLETAEVFAWALAGIFLCAVTDIALRASRARMGKHDLST